MTQSATITPFLGMTRDQFTHLTALVSQKLQESNNSQTILADEIRTLEDSAKDIDQIRDMIRDLAFIASANPVAMDRISVYIGRHCRSARAIQNGHWKGGGI